MHLNATDRPADNPPTTALVQRCLHGNQQAWNELVARYARLVHSVPVRHGLAPHKVDVVGQEIFLALAQNLHAIDDPERLPGWLVTTARRTETSLDDAESDAPGESGRSQLVSPLPTSADLVDGRGRCTLAGSAS